MDLELGLIGAEVDDTEADFIAKVCEEELLRGISEYRLRFQIMNEIHL